MLVRNFAAFCRSFKLPRSLQSARHVYMYSPEPFHPIPDREPRLTTAEEAVSVITTGTLIPSFMSLTLNNFDILFLLVYVLLVLGGIFLFHGTSTVEDTILVPWFRSAANTVVFSHATC